VQQTKKKGHDASRHHPFFPIVPCVPEGVRGVVECSTNTVMASWDAAAGAESYTSQLEGAGGFSSSCPTANTSCRFPRLQCAQTFVLSVTATSTCDSAGSAEISTRTGNCQRNRSLLFRAWKLLYIYIWLFKRNTFYLAFSTKQSIPLTFKWINTVTQYQYPSPAHSEYTCPSPHTWTYTSTNAHTHTQPSIYTSLCVCGLTVEDVWVSGGTWSKTFRF